MIFAAVTILGLFLGAPPKCDSRLDENFCFVRLPEQRPNYLWHSGETASVDMDSDGRAEKITILTSGQGVQYAVLADLKAKFGKPTKARVDKMRNGFGARWDEIFAEWRIGDAVIIFVGGDLESGGIILETRARYDAEHTTKSPGL
jgi:hypothetical protein